MKYAPLILSLATLIGGIVCLALDENEAGSSLLGIFVGQFVPSALPTRPLPEDAP